MANYSALDSAIEGCIAAEIAQGYGDHTVGPDGSPDTNGETTLDAMIVSGGLTCARVGTRCYFLTLTLIQQHLTSTLSSLPFPPPLFSVMAPLKTLQP
jgi:hypothetical protein